MRALEQQLLIPGQRLVETSLAAEYRVGRNAVREAVQWLAAQGIIDISRHRSAALRRLDPAEVMDVLELAEIIIGVLVRAACRNYQAGIHEKRLGSALREAETADDAAVPGAKTGEFARARRHFYFMLLVISGNRTLHRLLPATGLYILFGQYPAAMRKRECLDDFRAIATAIANHDAEHAQALGRAHIGRMRKAVLGADETENHRPSDENCSTILQSGRLQPLREISRP